MAAMAVVRYIALAALVVWTSALLWSTQNDLIRHVNAIAYACGTVIVIALLVMKFVGPPPRGFIARLTLVVVMLAVTAAGQALRRSPTAHTVLIGLALVAFGWYAAHE